MADQTYERYMDALTRRYAARIRQNMNLPSGPIPSSVGAQYSPVNDLGQSLFAQVSQLNQPEPQPENFGDRVKMAAISALETPVVRNTLNTLTTPLAAVTGGVNRAVQELNDTDVAASIDNLIRGRDQDTSLSREAEAERQRLRNESSENSLGLVGEVIESAGENVENLWAGEETVFTQDALRSLVDPENERTNLGLGFLGFAGDVALDPLSWVGGAAVRGVTQAGTAARHAASPVSQRFRQAVRDSYNVSDKWREFVPNVARGVRNPESIVPGKKVQSRLNQLERQSQPRVAEAAPKPTPTNPTENLYPASATREPPAPTNRQVQAHKERFGQADPDKLPPSVISQAEETVGEVVEKTTPGVTTAARSFKVPDIFRERVAQVIDEWENPNLASAADETEEVVNPKYQEYLDEVSEADWSFHSDDWAAEVPASVAVRVARDETTPEEIADLQRIIGNDWEDQILSSLQDDFINEVGEQPWLTPERPAAPAQVSDNLNEWLDTVDDEVIDSVQLDSGLVAPMNAARNFQLGKSTGRQFQQALEIKNGRKLTPAEIKNLRKDNVTALAKLHQEAVTASDEARILADEDALVPRDAPVSEPGWRPGTPGGSLPDNMEIIDQKEWGKLRRRLNYARNKGWLSPEEYTSLVKAYEAEDVNEWRRLMEEISYDGQPSAIDTDARRAGDELSNIDDIADEAAESVGQNSPAQQLANDPLKALGENEEIARDALRATMKTEFNEKRISHSVGPTKTGAYLTPDDGAAKSVTGRYFDSFGRFSQYTLLKNALSRLNKVHGERIRTYPNGKKRNFQEQAIFRYAEVMPILRQADNWLDSQGIISTLGTSSERAIPMSAANVLDALPQSFVTTYVFQPNADIPLTNIMEAADLIIKNRLAREAGETVADITTENLAAILKKAPGARAGGSNTFSGIFHKGRKNVDQLKANRLRIFNQRRKGKFTFSEMVDIEALDAANMILSASDNLYQQAITRSARYSAEVAAEAAHITKQVADDAIRAIDSDEFAAVIQRVENVKKNVDAAAGDIGAKPEAAMRAEVDAEDIIENKLIESPRTPYPDYWQNIIDARNTAAAKTLAERVSNAAKVNDLHQKQFEAVVNQSAQQTPLARLKEWNELHTDAIESGLSKTYGRYVDWFARDFGMERIGQAVSRYRTILRPMRFEYRNSLNRAAKMWDGKEIPGVTDNAFKAAFNELRAGKSIDSVHPDLRPAVDSIRPLVDFFFAADNSILSNNALNRFVNQGFDLDVINRAFEAAKYPHVQFDLKAAQAAVKAGEFETIEQALGAQWRTWKIQDPAEFLGVSETVLNHIATIDATVRQGIKTARDLGLVRNKPTKGFVKYESSDPESVVNNYWPKGTYVRADIAREFGVMDKVLRQSLIPTSKLGEFVSKNFMPIMGMWKSGMTIWNPRHYFRNGVGDISLNYLAGVTDPRSYATAFRIMGSRGDYGMWDGLEAMQQLGRGDVKYIEPGQAAFTLKNGAPVTPEQIYQGLRARAALVSFPVRENLMDDITDLQALERWQRRTQITGGRAKQVVTKTHEWRDHFIRMAHAVDIMKKGRFKSVEEALDKAAAEVRRWHPDGSDLTHFENKYMRVIFPFYSWTRRALPLVIESMLTRPWRFMAYPKAYYNFAESMGIDLSSISDPFPEDQMFPEFMTERMTGPLHEDEEGNYIGYHPGVVQDDLTGFINDPISEVRGMMTPLATVPLSLATNTHWGLPGVNISDTSDFVDSQIPGLNVLASITGVSPTGTLAGEGLRDEEPGSLEFHNNIDRGLRGPMDTRTALNWLTGLQQQNMSQPNYINLAEIEERDRQLNRWRWMNGAG